MEKLKKYWKDYRLLMWEQNTGISAQEWREFKKWKKEMTK